MRIYFIAILPIVLAAGQCAPPPLTAPQIPPAAPADIEAACGLPEIQGDAFADLITHRQALVECGGAARINAKAWRALSDAVRQ